MSAWVGTVGMRQRHANSKGVGGGVGWGQDRAKLGGWEGERGGGMACACGWGDPATVWHRATGLPSVWLRASSGSLWLHDSKRWLPNRLQGLVGAPAGSGWGTRQCPRCATGLCS